MFREFGHLYADINPLHAAPDKSKLRAEVQRYLGDVPRDALTTPAAVGLVRCGGCAQQSAERLLRPFFLDFD